MLRDLARKLGHVLAAFGLNLVPAGGWFLEGWSAATTLGVYWFETLVASLLIAVRIVIHRRLRPCRGHFRYEPRADHSGRARGPRGTYLASYLPIALIFTLAHGFFLGMMVLLLTLNGHAAEMGFDWTSFRNGCALIVGFLLLDFAIDAPGLRNRPFRWLERVADRNLARVFVVHLVLIFGMGAVAFTGVNRAFFGVFFVLKTMLDLANILPQWDPEKPPGWLCWLMDRVPRAPTPRRRLDGKPPETFAEFWAADRAHERSRLAANEQSFDPAAGA